MIGLRRTSRGFRYAMNRNGDGTVPLTLAKLPKLKAGMHTLTATYAGSANVAAAAAKKVVLTVKK